MNKKPYCYKTAVEPDFSLEFKSWLFKNKLYDFQNFEGTRKYFEDNEDDNPCVYEVNHGEEKFIFSMETIFNQEELARFEGRILGFEEDLKLVHTLFYEDSDVHYFELEIEDEYFE